MPPATQVDPGASRARHASDAARARRLRVSSSYSCVSTCDYVSGRLEKMRRVQHCRVPGRRPSYIFGVTHTEFLETGRQNVETRRAGPLSSSQ
jgi:hypothetical protein